MDLQLTAIVGAVWVATGLTRFVIMRPAAKVSRQIMTNLFYEIGLTEDELQNSQYLLGMRIATYLELISDVVLAPYYLVRDNVRFFNHASIAQVKDVSIHNFRKMVYAQGEHVPLLEAYEAKMEEEARQEAERATFH